MESNNNSIMPYNQHPVRTDLALFEGGQEDTAEDNNMIGDLLRGIRRRWKIISLISLIVMIPGLIIIWTMIKPGYETEGAIEVTAARTIIFSLPEEMGTGSDNFMRTEAAKIASPPVFEKAADILQKKNLNMFANTDDIFTALQGMAAGGTIDVRLVKGTNLIKILMYTSVNNRKDSIEVVNSLMSAYIAVRQQVATQGDYDRLTYLETEKKKLTEKLQMQRAVIRRLADEYGTTNMTARQEQKFAYVSQLQSTLNDIETKRIALGAQKELIKNASVDAISPEDQIKMRFERINSDPTVNMLTNEVTNLERQLIIAKQNFKEDNPRLFELKSLYSSMKTRLDEKRDEVGKEFEEDIRSQMESISQYKMQDIEGEMASLEVHEAKIKETLEAEDQKTRELGQKQLAIRDEQDKLEDIKQLLETVRTRITQLEMEGKRPARISVAYLASTIPEKTKQLKFTAVCIFGALGAGIAVAFLAERTDPRLRTPKDVATQVGVPIIGTTSKMETSKKTLLSSVVAEDYRTIRANLELLNAGGIPEKMIITSSGIQEGKTTFSINMTTSLAKSGKRVLLIDGDLRKPDVAKALNLPETRLGLQDILAGKNFDDVVCRDCIPGMDVLTSAPCTYDPSLACELLNRVAQMDLVNSISEDYDHIIIDTPPVLAGPDALLWSKMVDGVIMTSYSGQTVRPDMQDALKKLKHVNANILGAVLHSVENDYSYYRYGYDYYTQRRSKKARERDKNRPLLLTLDQEVDNS